MNEAGWLRDSDVTQQVASELESLSTHLRAVGMEGLAQQLERKAFCLDGAVEALERGINAKVSGDLDSARKTTGAVFRAALAVAERAK